MKILIIEDEPAIADTLVYAIKTEGWQPHWLETGQAALDYLEHSPADLVLLDIGLPDINGFDVCKIIRKTSDIPIMFLTSRTEDIDQIVGLELGADDYITKPFSPRVLTARIRTRLRAKQTARNETPQGFQIDQNGYRILLDDTDMQLSRYEFRILQVLIEHPGRVYSRTQLMDMVWEEPERSFDRTVDTHIKTIRQKIKQIDSNNNMIKTHRGLGYSYRP